MDFSAFTNDQKTQSAVILQLALIGELAKRIPEATRAMMNVPWKDNARLSHIWQISKDSNSGV